MNCLRHQINLSQNYITSFFRHSCTFAKGPVQILNQLCPISAEKCQTHERWSDQIDKSSWIFRSTINNDCIIRATSPDDVYMWVDAPFAVHSNMRSHTGGIMSFGTGIVHAKSSKQKLNTHSSTEANLVGVSDYLPYHIWMDNFMKSQG